MVITENSELALFLGAGASKPFGYPTTKDFMEIMSKSLNGVQKTIMDTLTKINDIKDIEHCLEYFDATDQYVENKYVGAFYSAFQPEVKLVDNKNLNWIDFRRASNNLKNNIYTEIFNQYDTDLRKQQSISKIYSEFISTISKFFNKNEFEILDIFTINYDRVIEEYVNNISNNLLIDGFRYLEENQSRIFDPHYEYDEPRIKSILNEGKYQVITNLYKLHGSLNWRKRNDGIIECVQTEEKCNSSNKKFEKNLLIYPAEKDYRSEEPFKTMYQFFENSIDIISLFIVIGYSFRDQQINDVFKKFINNDKNHLLVISPNASRNIKENFLQDNTIPKQILPIEAKFGEKETLQKIATTLFKIK